MKKLLSVFVVVSIFISVFTVSAFAGKHIEPKIIETVYETEDVVVADIVLTESPYFADNTGKEDCSAVLQQAINDCYANGGGTIFLPVGEYRLKSSIDILPFVTVMGDWQDPDAGHDYGTVIIADVESTDNMNPALFTVGGSSGAVGLTVWYPNQSLDNVKPYPYTFYVNGNGSSYMLQTVKNCTLLNSYRGIGASSENENGIYSCHEMFSIERVKGTVLYEGLNNYNSADVDTGKTFYISGKYWAESGERFNAPDRKKLDEYTKNNTSGMVLGDLEWPEYADIKIDSCKYGIRFEKGPRISFAGSFYDLEIANCLYGVYAKNGTVQSNRGKQWGIAICNGRIEGKKIAIYDYGKNVTMLTNVTVKGLVLGRNIHRETAGTDKYKLDYSRNHYKPTNNLYIVNADKSGKTDVSAVIQSQLDKAVKTGGVVYIPGGMYRLDNPIKVPANVELRGSSSVATRCQSGDSNGTLLLSYYGYLDENPNAEPLVTLGDNSGISGIRITYAKNNPVDTSSDYKKTSPAIYSTGDGSYAVNNFVILSSKGLDFENAKNILIKKNVLCCFENAIGINSCEDVHIEGNLQNANTLSRNAYRFTDIPEFQDWVREHNLFDYMFIPKTRVFSDYIIIKDSKDVTIFNTFIYGGRCFIISENTNCVAANVGCDGNSNTNVFMKFIGGDNTIINFMRSTSNGKDGWNPFEVSNKGKLKVYNRVSVDLKYNEFTEFRNVSLKDLTVRDLKTYNNQALIRIYISLGKLITKIFQ